MPMYKRWHFEVRGKDIVFIREGEERDNVALWAKIVTSGKEYARGAAKLHTLLVSATYRI